MCSYMNVFNPQNSPKRKISGFQYWVSVQIPMKLKCICSGLALYLLNQTLGFLLCTAIENH